MSATPTPRDALGRAMAAHQAGRLEEADALYRRAIEADPGSARALRLRGILARERGDLAASGRYLARAAEVAPADAAPLCELALTEMRRDDLDAALRHLRAAVARDGRHVRSLANLGALLQYRGHVREAIGWHERALALDPQDAEVRCNLAKALVEVERGDDALVTCDEGLALAPAHPLLLGARGAVLCDLERYTEAVAALEGAVARNPDDDMALVNLAYANARRSRHDHAVEALHAALRVNPDSGRAAADLVNLLGGTGCIDEALQLAEDFLARHPGECHVVAAQAFALHDAGRGAEAAQLLDFARLVHVEDIRPPAGETLAGFCARLAVCVTADASLVASPASKSTRGGFQTGELDLAGDAALAALRAQIAAAVDGHRERLLALGLADHPVMAHAGAPWSLRPWGTVLETDGRQLPHIHPQGWLSGVCYVDLPADMGAAGEHAGWIEFGAPPGRFLIGAGSPVRRFEPRLGRLVLFPSYFYHRTLPFRSDARRVSIAFDVVPRAVR